MNIIFIRHGIAENPQPGKSDDERELTEGGRILLQDQVDYLRDYLKNADPFLITSPLTRARQTAEVFSASGLGAFEMREFAATGDFQALKQTARSHSQETLVIIGHLPHLAKWSYNMTDYYPKLEKGSALAIEIKDLDSLKGEIKWILPLAEYDRLAKYDQLVKRDRQKDWELQFHADMEEVFHQCIRRIFACRTVYLVDPKDIESVHKLRVKIRQLRSLVSFTKPLLKKKLQKKIQNSLKAMALECAYLREVDVLTTEWQKYEKEFKNNDLTGHEFLKVLIQEREKEECRLFTYLQAPDFEMRLKDLERQLIYAIDVEDAKFSDLNQMVQFTLKQWHQEMKEAYRGIHENDLAVIHALRIRVKKARYIMEIFQFNEEEDPNGLYKEMYKEIKAWQEVLGNITDANRNPHAVDEIAVKFPDQSIEAEIALFKEIQTNRSQHLYKEFFEQTERV